METLNLHNYFRSSTSYRVRIALELLELPYNYLPIHLLNNGGEQNSESYRKINPIGGVPTLEHNGKLISQSVAIVEYLHQSFKDNSTLYPTDLHTQAKVRQFCEIINSDIHPLLNLKVTQHLENQFKITPEQKTEWFNKWTKSGFTALEKLLEEFSGDFCFGNQITAADIFLVPHLYSAKRFNLDISQFKLINKINDHCLTLKPFIKAHPHRQPDTPEELKA